MLKITILAVGRIKEKYFSAAIAEYAQRLKPYAVLKVVELEPVSFSKANQEKSKREEGIAIEKFLTKQTDSFIITLDEKGKEFGSVEFSNYLDRINKPIIIVIGGTVGLANNVKGKADLILSLSALTFPHELARVVLYEQIYRAVTIAKNKNYHY